LADVVSTVADEAFQRGIEVILGVGEPVAEELQELGGITGIQAHVGHVIAS